MTYRDIKKYEFNSNFSSVKSTIKEQKPSPESSQDSVPSLEEKLQERHYEKGYEEGFKAGKKDAVQEENAQLKNTVQLLLSKVDNLIHYHEDHQEELKTIMLQTSIELFKKMLPQYIHDHGHLDIENFIGEQLQALKNEESIHIKLNPDQTSKMKEFINTLERNNVNRVKFIADETLQPGDCEIQWDKGVCKKNMQLILANIQDNLGLPTQLENKD